MEEAGGIAAQIDAKFKVAVVDYRAPDAAKRFTDSLKTTGFAVLTNHPVSNDLIQDVYTEWRDLMIRLNEHAATAEAVGSSEVLKQARARRDQLAGARCRSRHHAMRS